MGLRKDDATDADKIPRDQDEVDLRGSIGSQDGEMKLKIHKDKYHSRKRCGISHPKNTENIRRGQAGCDSEQLDFSKKEERSGIPVHEKE